MKKTALFLALVTTLALAGCRWKRVTGNGNIVTKDISVNHANRIRLSGSVDLYITQGAATAVKIEGDENIIPLIKIEENDGSLIVKQKDHISFSTENPIKVYITTDKLNSIRVSGSGDVFGRSKFSGSEKITTGVSGSGNISLELNAPEVESEITGSGSIHLTGETANQKVRITGSGDFNGSDLKSENATVRITGSGDVKVFADAKLDIHITGGGSIYYKGNPVITQKVTGSGDIKKMD